MYSIVQRSSIEEFKQDSHIIGDQTAKFLSLVYPSYLVDRAGIGTLLERDSAARLQGMSFFRIGSCTAENSEHVFDHLNEKFEKLFTALHSIDISIAYGIISRDGVTNLVLGVSAGSDAKSVKSIAQGMLSGIDMQEIDPDFSPAAGTDIHHGILTGVPSLFVKERKQSFSLVSIMRSLNGQNYTCLFLASPLGQEVISQNLTELISVRDQAFAVSKRNIARSNSISHNESDSTGTADGKTSVSGPVGGAAGALAGGMIGSFVPIIGTAVGAAVGGGLDSIIGSLAGNGRTHSDTYSKSVSDTITNGDSISGDIQNGFALELMNYADHAIERFKGGRNNGIWQTAIVYSAESAASRNIIRACLNGELSRNDAEKLPMLAFEPKVSPEILAMPNFLGTTGQNPLCSCLNSAELGLLCTVPTESVPDFELRLEKKFPLIAGRHTSGGIQIGSVADGKRPIANMPFCLSEQDLNKHTFVCGITGSGKTTTVKKILIEAKKPFLVIESAKKEYRNIAVNTTVYTPGKPEIHAPQMNPFYIMPGVSPQVHIDYLKDLFNAAFAFYGPMPYILEKCLHTVYRNKGWDLTLGYHPLLANVSSRMDFFSIEYAKAQYSRLSHKFLFPTMQELKDEIARYVEEDLKYDGEVAGNVKTAMRVRLENLCVGAKGYTFNTSEFFDFHEMLEKNVIFELEGLADDSDKAFSVGLLVIFMNEYRQVQKELSGNQKTGLQHLLVIEEAHRLLKNLDTERLTETSGNSRGKAIEHFTNMLAEMRSYGQGVIVAEQIPAKIAPEVIKNSSTKIVQRIVSADDQQTIANAIGIKREDAIQLGSLEAGFAYCHKEGMALPVPVKIADDYISDVGRQSLDVFVTDEELYNRNVNRFDEISLSMIRGVFGGNIFIKQKVIAFLNTLMTEDEDCCAKACKILMDCVGDEMKRNDIRLPLTNDPARLHAWYLTELILSAMVRGVYCARILPEDEFVKLLETTFYAPSVEKIQAVKKTLQGLYSKDLAKYARYNAAALILRSKKTNTDIPGTVREYFIGASDTTVSEIVKLLKGGDSGRRPA